MSAPRIDHEAASKAAAMLSGRVYGLPTTDYLVGLAHAYLALRFEAERALTPEEAAYIPPRLRFPSTIEDRPVWESIVAKCRAITGGPE